MGPRVVLAALLVVAGAAAAQQAARVFVLAAGEAVELDAATFGAMRRTSLPGEVSRAAGELQANRHGQLLVRAPGDEGRFWFFDGRTGWFVGGDVSGGGGVTRCVLSAGGQRLYWFENDPRATEGGGDAAGVVPSVSTTFRVWRTDLAGRGRSPIASLPLGPCRCETGACDETCPEVATWVPEAGIDDFFILSRWIPGQLGATYQASTVYRASASGWKETRLPAPLETVLDAADGGRAIVHTVNDTACCGWMNESGDRTLLLRDGRNVVLFDERGEYANDDYDVSFHTANAKLSPGARLVAMTVVSTLQAGEVPRLSLDGRGDPTEVQRVRGAGSELPTVIVADVGAGAPRRLARIPHATLVGWLDEARLLVRREKTFEAWDVRAGHGTKVPIPDGAQVLVR